MGAPHRPLSAHRCLVSIESFDGFPQGVWTEMRITLRHLWCLVSHQGLDPIEIHTFHRQSRRECVPQVVEVEVRNRSTTQCGIPISIQAVHETTVWCCENMTAEFDTATVSKCDHLVSLFPEGSKGLTRLNAHRQP